MREPADWAQIEFGEGAQLLLGWRGARKQIAARPVRLEDEVTSVLVAACREALIAVGRAERRAYSGVPALEDGEYLSIPLPSPDCDDVQTESNAAGNEAAIVAAGAALGADAAEASRLIQLVRAAFEDDAYLTRSELHGRWLFYAVVVEVADSTVPLAFVRQYNPQRGFSTGRLLTAFHNRLSRFDDPVLNFDLRFDLIIASDEIAVLNTTAFDRLFSDLDLAATQVPQQVAQLGASLGVGLAAGVSDFLDSTIRSRDALVRRLRRIVQLGHLDSVTYQTMTAALVRHGFDANTFGPGPDLDLPSTQEVFIFLDMLEQLYYETDFTGEHRRADRYSLLG